MKNQKLKHKEPYEWNPPSDPILYNMYLFNKQLEHSLNTLNWHDAIKNDYFLNVLKELVKKEKITQLHVDCTLVFYWNDGFNILASKNKRSPDNLKLFKSHCITTTAHLDRLKRAATQAELYEQIIEYKYIYRLKVIIDRGYEKVSPFSLLIKQNASDEILTAMVDCAAYCTDYYDLRVCFVDLLKAKRYKILRLVLMYNALGNGFYESTRRVLFCMGAKWHLEPLERIAARDFHDKIHYMAFIEYILYQIPLYVNRAELIQLEYKSLFWYAHYRLTLFSNLAHKLGAPKLIKDVQPLIVAFILNL